MKKLIFRNFYYDLFKNFLINLIVLGTIVFILQAINNLDFISQDGHGFNIYLKYIILNLPKIIHRLIPFVFFISVFFTVLIYEQRNELYIFWVNGISKNYFMRQLLFLSIFLLVFQILIGSIIVPNSLLKARSYLKESNIDFFSSLIKPGKFLNITNGLTIFINNEDSNGNYEDIFLDDTRSTPRMIYAKKGYFSITNQNKSFILLDGKVINNENSKIRIFKFDKINIDLSEMNSNTIMVPKIQEINSLILLKCFFYQKIDREEFNCDKNINPILAQELFKRFLKPAYILLISLICGFLIVRSKNDNRYKINRNLAFSYGFLILLISEASIRYISYSNIILNIFTIISPIIIFIITLIILKKKFKYV